LLLCPTTMHPQQLFAIHITTAEAVVACDMYMDEVYRIVSVMMRDPF